MRINLNKAYVPQAGDILSWISGEDKILFAVTKNDADSNKIVGVTLFDTRTNITSKIHIVRFTEQEYNYRLQLVCSAKDTYLTLDEILDEWRDKNE